MEEGIDGLFENAELGKHDGEFINMVIDGNDLD